ncbi:hypothetical protein ACH5RR_022882 [Cinchona calisaya]|uniref:Uncharacterized protein n=1 Tax=Cinchona calisaya TaxID=153742 RepID=A0ABD2ZCC8_9GENT
MESSIGIPKSYSSPPTLFSSTSTPTLPCQPFQPFPKRSRDLINSSTTNGNSSGREQIQQPSHVSSSRQSSITTTPSLLATTSLSPSFSNASVRQKMGEAAADAAKVIIIFLKDCIFVFKSNRRAHNSFPDPTHHCICVVVASGVMWS